LNYALQVVFISNSKISSESSTIYFIFLPYGKEGKKNARHWARSVSQHARTRLFSKHSFIYINDNILFSWESKKSNPIQQVLACKVQLWNKWSQTESLFRYAVTQCDNVYKKYAVYQILTHASCWDIILNKQHGAYYYGSCIAYAAVSIHQYDVIRVNTYQGICYW
jgi:hypothetical protein